MRAVAETLVVRRVLAVHPHPDLYGADLMMLRSLRAIRSAGMDVQLVVPEPGPLLERLGREAFDVRIVAAPVLRKALLSPRRLLSLLAHLPGDVARILAVLRDYRPDIVYVNTITLPHWTVVPRLVGIPTACHIRELEDQVRPAVRKALTAPLLGASVVVANSNATAAFLAAQWRSLAPRTRVVLNGYVFPDVAWRPHPPERARRVLVVGRLNLRKGQDLAIAAIERLVAEGRDVHLDLVGSVFRGYEWVEDELRRQAEAAGVGDRVHFHGYQSSVAAYMLEADVVAVPSRTEPFGGVAVEAMGIGCPVVVSGVGGLEEIALEQVTAEVVRPGAVGDLARAIARLLDDSQESAAMGSRARADVRTRFSCERYERDLVDLLRRGGDPAP